jgi:hypothetical protein
MHGHKRVDRLVILHDASAEIRLFQVHAKTGAQGPVPASGLRPYRTRLICVSGTAAERSSLVDSHFLIPMQSRVLPLLTALRYKDFYFCRCPAKCASEEADSETVQAVQVVRKSILLRFNLFWYLTKGQGPLR